MKLNITGGGPKAQPDPYVIKSKGKFYLYCTGNNGVHLYESEAIDGEWAYKGLALKVDGEKEYWAPCVIEIDNKYYMYYSSMPSSSFDVHTQAIKVAVSDGPAGPFKVVKQILPPFSIDPHVVENKEGLFIFYSLNDYDAVRAGTLIVADKMNDPLSVSSNPRKIVAPTLDEEIFERDRFKKGQHWHTVEGAFYFKKDGYHYCMYSGNCFEKAAYHIGYAVCEDKNDMLNELDFKKYPFSTTYQPLLCSDNTEISTGHNSVIEEGGQLYVFYHGRDVDSGLTGDDRTARYCKLFHRDGILRVEKINGAI